MPKQVTIYCGEAMAVALASTLLAKHLTECDDICAMLDALVKRAGDWSPEDEEPFNEPEAKG